MTKKLAARKAEQKLEILRHALLSIAKTADESTSEFAELAAYAAKSALKRAGFKYE